MSDQDSSNDTTLCQVEELNLEATTPKTNSSAKSNSSLTLTQNVFQAVERKAPKTKRPPFTLITMSAGESMTDVFPEWVKCSYFGPPGPRRQYRPYDLNMPILIPIRPIKEYLVDPPLTEHGKVCSALVSRGLIRHKLRINVVYCAPEMTCVQTAAAAVTAQLCKRNVKILIKIEPALANWKNFRKPGEELLWGLDEFYKSLGYPIDLDYEPFMTMSALPAEETPREYFQRLLDFYSHLVQENEEECILIVGHSSTVHMGRDLHWETKLDLMNIQKSVDPCSLVAVHFAIDGEHTALTRPTLGFTRTLYDAKMKRQKEKQNKNAKQK